MEIFLRMSVYVLAWMVEIVTVLYCIHKMFESKARFGLHTWGIIILDVLLMFLVWRYDVADYIKITVYIVLLVYCKYQFGHSWWKSIIMCVLGILLSALFQVCGAFAGMWISQYVQKEVLVMLAVNVVALVIAILSFLRINIHAKVSNINFQFKDWKSIIFISVGIVVFLMIDYLIQGKTNQIYYLMTIGLCVYVYFVLMKSEMQKREYEKKILEARLKDTYGNMYKELLEVVRANQHDFKNQINTLYSMHITARTLEELVEGQQKYSQIILEKNEYNEILTGCNNPILASYIYCKCQEIKKQDIAFTSSLCVKEAECSMALHELIEVLGILLTNAMEEVRNQEFKKIIELKIQETLDDVEIIVSNTTEKMLITDVEKMFVSGFSTKGESRGIGLAQLKKIAESVNAGVYVQCYMKEELRILEFKIVIPK